jgi:hypothetical protein
MSTQPSSTATSEPILSVSNPERYTKQIPYTLTPDPKQKEFKKMDIYKCIKSDIILDALVLQIGKPKRP